MFWKKEFSILILFQSNFTIKPYHIINDLNRNEHCACRTCAAGMTGSVDQNMKTPKLSRQCHARWMTFAFRILRYVFVQQPSTSLWTLAEFCTLVYFQVVLKLSIAKDLQMN